MNRNKIVVLVSIVGMSVGTLVIFPMIMISDRSDLKGYCEQIGGDWWEEEELCRNLSEEFCERINGKNVKVGFPQIESEGLEGIISGFRQACDISLDNSNP